MKPFSLSTLALMCSVMAAPVAAQTALDEFLSVPGARVTLPVTAGTGPFSWDFVQDARNRFNNFHLQMGGDHTLYYLMNLPEFMQTALAMPATDYTPLNRALSPAVAALEVETDTHGPLPLEEYARHPGFRHQGTMMIHKGKVVFESLPGMGATDVHFWASAAKATVGLIVAMLVEEGRVELDRPITDYVPTLAGTAWEQASVLDLLNHTTGLDTEETGASILNPDSPVVAFFSASFGAENPGSGQMVSVLDSLRQMTPLSAEGPGDVFRYSSANTHVLTMLVENLEQRPWTDVFEDRVWGKLQARMPAMFNLDPDGVALPLGLLSTTLEDMARFGMLFTPSWPKVADEQVVTDAVLQRIYAGANPEAFKDSVKDKSGEKSFAGERAHAVAYQFDWMFDDGAMYKSGNLNQGIYVDPKRDFVGVVFSSTPYVPPFGETKMPAFFRAAAKLLDQGR